MILVLQWIQYLFRIRLLDAGWDNIDSLVEEYHNESDQFIKSLFNIVLTTEGAVSYQDVAKMTGKERNLLIEVANERSEVLRKEFEQRRS